jgi:DNA-binding beta-propeller fold protein YncE
MWAALLLGVLVLPPSADAASSPRSSSIHVDVLACITANSVVAAHRGCRTVPGAGYESSQDTGIDGTVALATSGSRTSLYAVGNRNSSLAQLTLGADRAFSFAGCVTGNTFLDACAHVPGATANAPEAPISYPTAAAISPDGRFLYLASGDFHGSVIARFARDPIVGTVTYEGCLTGDLGAGLTGPGHCAELASATREGFGSGLYEPTGLAISRDGTHLYVTAGGDSSISAFNRDPATGALSFTGCITSNPKAAACVKVPGGNNRVLDGVSSPVISADGKNLYAAANRAETVLAFTLGPSGAISLASCVSRRADRPPCRRGRPSGPVQALSNPGGVLESADGRFIYVTSTYGTIVTLERNRASGALTPMSCVSSDLADRGRCTLLPGSRASADDVSLLSGARTPVLSANGRLLITPVRSPDGIVELRRSSRTGALAFLGCATGNLRLSTAGHGVCQPLPGATRDGTNSGYYKTTALSPGPGNLIYAVASRDATIFLLRP